MILDSGCRSEFPTGAVRDIQEGKGRCDLMPLDVVAYILDDDVISNINKFRETNELKWLYEAIYDCEFFDDLVNMVLEVSVHFEEGAKKYGESNWQKGIPIERYIDSAIRHYLKHCRGDKDERHDRAFYWNIMCAIWTVTHIERSEQ